MGSRSFVVVGARERLDRASGGRRREDASKHWFGSVPGVRLGAREHPHAPRGVAEVLSYGPLDEGRYRQLECYLGGQSTDRITTFDALCGGEARARVCSPGPGLCYQRISVRNAMAFVPAAPSAPSCRAPSNPRTAPSAKFHRVPARYVRLDPSESESPAYGVTMPCVPGKPMP